ncbi:hypothetical protein [Endozoicomonas sp.]|uniref:hypothetical protein n=1 Tax=Endozoicomonas sp. TaxID=1892382 RepID=UPI00383A4393
MKELEIINDTATIKAICVSEAILAYWNFRHSAANTKRSQVTDDIIRMKAPALHNCLNEIRRLKREAEKPATGLTSSPSALSQFQIAAISQRLNYVDEIANKCNEKNPDFKIYHWDQSNNKDHKPEKQIRTSQSAEPKQLKQTDTDISRASTLFNASDTPFTVNNERKKKQFKFYTTDSSRKRKLNHPFPMSSTETKLPEKRKK